MAAKTSLQESLIALASYDRSLDELAASQPEFISTTGKRALEVLGRFVTSRILRGWVNLRRRERPLPLRLIVAQEFRRLALARAEIEGRFLMILAQLVHQIRKNWELQREDLDASVERRNPESPSRSARRNESGQRAELYRDAAKALADWRDWPNQSIQSLARSITSAAGRRRNRKRSRSVSDRAVLLSHWGEQLRSLEAEIEMEVALVRCEDRLLELSRTCLGSIERERGDLLEELDNFAGWLRNRIDDRSRDDVPPPRIDVVPARSRIAGLESGLRSALHNLPRQVRLLKQFSALPRRWTKPKELNPSAMMSNAFAHYGRGEIEATLSSIEAEHNRIVQVIEQVREVVAFGLSTNKQEKDEDSVIAREALQNALSLLEFHRQDAAAALTETDVDIARTIAVVFEENRSSLSRTRLGILAYIGQRGVQQAGKIISRNAAAVAMRLSHLTLRTLQRLSRKFLVGIGWMAETKRGAAQVVMRPFLPHSYTIDLSTKELPAIYRCLFRFEAVQDPRFLVGRDLEMEAIGDARSLWEAGRPVAVLIIGERGSGKTSLINCDRGPTRRVGGDARRIQRASFERGAATRVPGQPDRNR